MMSPNQTRRRALLAAAALASLSPAAPAWAQALKQTAKAAGPARIVIVGAGVGGASTAKYLKLFSPGLDVTLIDRNPNYVRHYGSSEVVVGTKTIEDMTVSYDALKSKYGVKVVQDTVTGLDPDRKEVVGEAGRYPYDKLVVAPGVELLYDAVPGYSAELAATKIPSGWIAGPQTVLLAKQLQAMPEGGTFVIVSPPNPYRCPPGPYERTALVTEWCAKHNPRAKIINLDPKNDFVTDATMILGWNRLYGYPIPKAYQEKLAPFASPGRADCALEWVTEKEGGRTLSIDPDRMIVKTVGGDVKADVLNIVPAHARRGRRAPDGLGRQDQLLPGEPRRLPVDDHPGGLRDRRRLDRGRDAEIGIFRQHPGEEHRAGDRRDLGRA